MERTERLPVDRDQLAPRRPIPMRLVVCRANPGALGIDPNDMRAVVLDEVRHALLQNLVCRVLREREDVLRRVDLLLVDAAALDADSIDEQRDEVHGHFDLGLVARPRRGRYDGARLVRVGAATAVNKSLLGLRKLGLET